MYSLAFHQWSGGVKMVKEERRREKLARSLEKIKSTPTQA
jgi:hypothetical protein